MFAGNTELWQPSSVDYQMSTPSETGKNTIALLLSVVDEKEQRNEGLSRFDKNKRGNTLKTTTVWGQGGIMKTRRVSVMRPLGFDVKALHAHASPATLFF